MLAEVPAGGCGFYLTDAPTLELEHLTLAKAPVLYTGSPASVTLKNSLLVEVAAIQDYTGRNDRAYGNAEEASAAGVFQTVGGGAYYLAANSLYRDRGTDQIDANLLADFAEMTTYPPELRATAITSSDTWGPRTARDTDQPDLGYHYPALDYWVSQVAIQNATLTLRNGVAVAAGAPDGFELDPGGTLTAEAGTLEMNRLLHQAVAQETSDGAVTLIAQTGASGASRAVDLRATQLVMPAGSGSHFSGGAATAQLALRDCEVYGGLLSCWGAGYILRSWGLYNNLWARVSVSLGNGADNNLTVHARNNTFWHCSVSPNMAPGGAWEWKDNLFDHGAIWLYYAWPQNDHNGYVGLSPMYGSGGNDVSLDSLDYLEDAWGRGWYSDTTRLTGAGSRTAAAAGLADYTTGLDQNLEGTGMVSIGFHHRSEAPRRVAHWRFNGANWLESEQGQGPESALGATAETGFDGTALRLSGASAKLIYPEMQPTGVAPNLSLQKGSIRLWFKPDWTLSTVPTRATLLEVGETVGNQWSLYFKNAGGTPEIDLISGNPGTPQLHMPMDGTFFSKWANSPADWLRLSVTWGSPSLWPVNKVYADSQPVSFNYGTWKYYGGTGIDPADLPDAAVRGQGFALSSAHAGGNVAGGLVDEVELFNYPIGKVEQLWGEHAWAAEAQATPTPHITLRQTDDPRLDATAYYYWRRPFGATTWTKVQDNPTSARTIEDSNVAVNVLYEYARSQTDPPGEDLQGVQTVGIELEPVHQRGHVILLVDPTFLPGSPNDLSAEIAQLKEDLVGDGWTVAGPLEARRHEEQTISPAIQYSPANKANLAYVHQLIAANYDGTPGVENVVFILGRVTIPYSGRGGFDGHPSHGGPWVADTYYGVLDEQLWTDNQTTSGAQWRVADDGYFDNDNAPPLDMAVGRVDFAKLDAFANADFLPPNLSGPALEAELLRLYLNKDHRYRMGELPVGKRMSYQDNIIHDYLLPDAARLGASLFGLDYGVCFNAKPYVLPQAPCLWAWYFNYGKPAQQYLGGDEWFAAEDRLVFSAEEPANLFYHLMGSFFADWNLGSTQSNPPDNLMRSLLATPNYGLACVAWPGWKFDRLGCGKHLGTAMLGRTGNQNRAFMSIIGDPTLRMSPMLPVEDLAAIRSGSTVLLTWTPSGQAGESWYIYRSTTGLDGFSTPLALATEPAFTDNNSPAGAMYQVRACRLEVTGGGSYWNLSQARFISVP
ncbi:MAG: hypothetical protein D6724_10645 [Armatimonadetes bacterium]|nr:MAG: hypothetical protein D6724_10645 [Armatimonadota bacterium]